MVRRNERRSGASSPELRKPGECLKLNFNNDASQSKLMARKDSEKDSDRPHYYSQFWLDVAAGRKVIGASKTNEEAETAESEPMEPATARKSGRTSVQPVADGRRDTYSSNVFEPEEVAEEEEEITEPEVEEEDLE